MYSYFTLRRFQIKELLLLTVQHTHQDLIKCQMILNPFHTHKKIISEILIKQPAKHNPFKK